MKVAKKCMDCSKLIKPWASRCRSCAAKERVKTFPMPKFNTGLSNDKNGRWSGDKPNYHGLHKRVYKLRGKAKKCLLCGSTKKVEWANISQKYIDINDFMELCHRHHSQYDRGLISL